METEPMPTAEETRENLSPQEYVNQLQERLLQNFQERGLVITSELVRRLITSVEVADLQQNETAVEYKLENLLATMDKGQLSLDREKFFELNEKQQHYILNHELGHQLDWLFRLIDSPVYRQLLDLIQTIPAEQNSYYTALVEANVKDDPDAKNKLQQECIAELFSQYLSSDGSFQGMFVTKLIQFPGNSEEAGFWSQYIESQEVMDQLIATDFEDEEQRQTFFAQHPQFQAHYEAYSLIHKVLTDPESSEKISEMMEGEFEFDESWLDYDMTVNGIPEKLPPVNPGPIKREPLPPSNASKSTGTSILNFVDFTYFFR